MPNERLLLGAMSGTSADGVDAALVHITGRGRDMSAKLLAHAYHAYSPELRKQILETRQRGDVRLSDLAEMGRQITLAYVQACEAAKRQGNVASDQIAAIAAHGQTFFHGPPNTIQIFDPSLLACETGIAVVSDFRRADLATGGQGAPLVPFADWILFRHPTKNRVLLNIGGIANITYLKAGGSIDEVIAFDTGPGNCISDWLMKDHGGVDLHGDVAYHGEVDGDLLESIDLWTYIEKVPPKSTDGPEMIAAFAKAMEKSGNSNLSSLVATAAVLTTEMIQHGVDLARKGERVDELICAGGGVNNRKIMWELGSLFDVAQPRGTKVLLLSDLFESDPALDYASAREALAFALLGAATLDGEPSNVPSATGASRRVVLGSITPKPLFVA